MSCSRTAARCAHETLSATLHEESRRLQTIKALRVCIQHAADDEVEFDASGALVDESLADMDRLEGAS